MRDREKIWDKLNIEEEELNSIYRSCVMEYTDKKDLDSLSIMLKNVSKNELIENSSIKYIQHTIDSMNKNA